VTVDDAREAEHERWRYHLVGTLRRLAAEATATADALADLDDTRPPAGWQPRLRHRMTAVAEAGRLDDASRP